jgi:hypothetical protein
MNNDLDNLVDNFNRDVRRQGLMGSGLKSEVSKVKRDVSGLKSEVSKAERDVRG